MSEFTDLLAVEQQATPDRARPSHPDGWTPTVEGTTSGGTATIRTEDRECDHAELLTDSGIDPARYVVVGDVQFRRWEQSPGSWCRYVKFTYAARDTVDAPDVDRLIREIRGHRKPKAEAPTGEHAFLLCLADWQIGKRGLEATTERVLSMFDQAEDRIRWLRRSGIDVGSIYVAGLGDLFEGCDGHYSMQTFEVEADRRTQATVVRRLLVKGLTRLAKLTDKMVVTTVPGNHGEFRKDGKAFTTFGDNDDVAVMEQVRDIFRANPEVYGHVAFHIPDQSLSVTLDVAGTVITFLHGHQAKGGGGPQAKLRRWWEKAAFAEHDAMWSQMLITGHYHTLMVAEDGGRTWMQCPTLDSGSQWWEESGGSPTKQGTLSLVVGESGWSHMEVIR